MTKTKTSDTNERRYFDVEVRADDESATPRIVGYAAKFNRDSQPLGFSQFIERIAPGAFSKTVKEADVRALGNHDPNIVLGRNKAGTLRLSEDKVGLRYDVDIDVENPIAMSWYRMVKRGDISQSSFGFQVVKDEWDYPSQDGEPMVRTLKEVRLFDVSPVTFPAYLDTESEARKAFRGLAESVRRSVDEVIDAVRSGEVRSLVASGGEPLASTPPTAVAADDGEPPEESRVDLTELGGEIAADIVEGTRQFGAADGTPTSSDLLLRAFLPPDGVEDLEEKYGVTRHE